jgi:hypothetical protein
MASLEASLHLADDLVGLEWPLREARRCGVLAESLRERYLTREIVFSLTTTRTEPSRSLDTQQRSYLPLHSVAQS